tara:strand:- start:683 stop:856 length:174 start_codon:yes stop_codon:yes gene_type:complete
MYCQTRTEAINNKNATVPKNINATRNANRSIRIGVTFNWPLFLPTPITALIASLIKT